MIEGAEYVSSRMLFEMIDPYDIYCYYLGYSPQPRKMYSSPFRRDSNPSFGLFSNKNTLLHKDFGDNNYIGNCINFVQQLTGLTYQEAIHKIIYDLRLNSSAVRRHNEIFSPKDKTLIQITQRPFNSLDIRYWNTYGISVEDLIKEDVFSIESLYINKQRLTPHELAFAYLFIDGDEEFLKIYQPFGRQKWLSNVPVKRALHLDRLEHKSDVVTIAKSKKDKIVLKKLITDVYECQKEGTEVISDYLDDFLDNHYDRKICFFDNDEPGKRANRALNPRGYEWINIPNAYYNEGIKDPSDFVRIYGYKELEKLLRRKDILKEFII
jgi:hypothetical protein